MPTQWQYIYMCVCSRPDVKHGPDIKMHNLPPYLTTINIALGTGPLM